MGWLQRCCFKLSAGFGNRLCLLLNLSSTGPISIGWSVIHIGGFLMNSLTGYNWSDAEV